MIQSFNICSKLNIHQGKLNIFKYYLNVVYIYLMVVRYLKKLELTFIQKVNNIEKMVNSQIAVTNKKKELAEEYDQLVPKLKLIQQKNKELISDVCYLFFNLISHLNKNMNYIASKIKNVTIFKS